MAILISDRPDHAAYFMRYGVRYVAWFCHTEDVERFFDRGVEWNTHAAVGTEPEPGKTYQDEGHLHCWADDCPELVAARDADFEAPAAAALALVSEVEE